MFVVKESVAISACDQPSLPPGCVKTPPLKFDIDTEK